MFQACLLTAQARMRSSFPIKTIGAGRPDRAVFHQNIFKTPNYSLSGYRIYCVRHTLSTQNLVVYELDAKGIKNTI